MKSFLRFPLRAFLVIMILAIYFLCSLFVRKDLNKFKTLSFFSRNILRAIGFQIEVDPQLIEVARGCSIVVSNHQSYLDIPLIASLLPSQFISTVEARKLPFFGFLIEKMGCLLIDRNSKTTREKEITAMSASLIAGNVVTFFPEAQSSNGSELLFFHRRFFEPAFALKRSALCLTIEYMSIGTEKVNSKNRHKVLWYRQNPIFAHVIGLFSIEPVKLRIRASRVDPTAFCSPEQYARGCQEAVRASWKSSSGEVQESSVLSDRKAPVSINELTLGMPLRSDI